MLFLGKEPKGTSFMISIRAGNSACSENKNKKRGSARERGRRAREPTKNRTKVTAGRDVFPAKENNPECLSFLISKLKLLPA